MLRLEIQGYGVVSNRVALVTLLGILGLSATAGYWYGNGETTLNSIQHIADKAGACAATVHTLKTIQVDSDKPTTKDSLSGTLSKTAAP